MQKIFRFCASSLLAFAFPRLLIAAGVPLLEWIEQAGVMVGAAAGWINPDITLWTITIFLALALYGIESWKHPALRAWERITSIGGANSNSVQAQANSTGSVVEPKLVTVSDAVMWAYEQIRKMPKFESTIREHYDSNPLTLPGKMAQMIFNKAHPEITIYGVYPPRTVEDKIPAEDARVFAFSNDAKQLIDQFDNTRRYINLRVNRADIERRIKDLSGDANTARQQEGLDSIRRDVFWLKENLSNYTPYSDIEVGAISRYQRLDASDHLIWIDENINQLRRDFLNRCGWIMRCKKIFDSKEEDQNTKREIIDLWQKLETAFQRGAR